MDLYSAFLTTAPFILLTISRGVTFGPMPVAVRHRARRISLGWFLNDLAAVLIVVAGAVISLLVLGDVVPANGIARISVVSGGLLALFLLLLHVVGDVLQLHRDGGESTVAAGT